MEMTVSATFLDLDFAALRTLRLVHDLGSFSRASEELGVSQSSVSYTISRLRHVFGDPLFVRQGAGIAPTERCDEIVARAAELLDRFEALAAPKDFDPDAAEATIGISCNYYERAVLLPHVMRSVRRNAPGIRLRVIPSTTRGREQLLRSESDVLIGPIEAGESGFYKRTLLTDRYRCIMDPGNPLAQGEMDIDRFVGAPQVLVHYGGSYRSQFLLQLDAEGRRLNTVMDIPSPANLPDILSDTDMIATVPSRIARLFGNSVAQMACPVSAEISIDMYWTARTHASATHAWVRQKIAAAAMLADA